MGQEIVEEVLRDDEEARNSDKKLLLRVWEREGLYLSREQQQRFMRCTTAETITRARRNLKDKYPPRKAVENTRMAFEGEYRKYYGH